MKKIHTLTMGLSIYYYSDRVLDILFQQPSPPRSSLRNLHNSTRAYCGCFQGRDLEAPLLQPHLHIHDFHCYKEVADHSSIGCFN